MPKHTPGPWTHEWDAAEGRYNVLGDENQIVACMPFHNRNDEIVDAIIDADARLIAAAPELLEALRRMATDAPIVSDAEEGSYCFYCYAKWDQGRAQFGDGIGMEHATDCEYIVARAAIAKAEP